MGLPASCNFRIFFACVFACVLRQLTTSSYRSLRWSAVAERKQGCALKTRKSQNAGNPTAGKDLPHARKINEKVRESGCNFGPSFGTSFGPRFGPYKYDLKERAPKLEPKLGPKPGPKIATNFANFFTHFSGMQQIFARYGVARVLQLSHFFCVRLCLRSATADHLKLPWRYPQWSPGMCRI